MRLVHIKEEYIDYLRMYDYRVQKNKGETRPYVGVLFQIQEVKYYAPLASPKKKHLKMKNSVDFLKLDNGRLGAINLNNMIPVYDDVLKPIVISDIENQEYKRLLEKQAYILRKDSVKVEKAAHKLYQILNKKEWNNFEKALKDRCCNLALLETKMEEYKVRNDERIHECEPLVITQEPFKS